MTCRDCFRASSGNGESSTSSSGASGAGHGGNGGTGANGRIVGTVYGHVYEPEHFGSRGGGSSGGKGGGILKINVRGTLKVDGTIHCNAQSGQASRSGGGSGGSIWITTNRFQGMRHLLLGSIAREIVVVSAVYHRDAIFLEVLC